MTIKKILRWLKRTYYRLLQYKIVEGETTLNADLYIKNLYIPENAYLNTNHFRVYVSRNLVIDGKGGFGTRDNYPKENLP